MQRSKWDQVCCTLFKEEQAVGVVAKTAFIDKVRFVENIQYLRT